MSLSDSRILILNVAIIEVLRDDIQLNWMFGRIEDLYMGLAIKFYSYGKFFRLLGSYHSLEFQFV